MEEQNIKTYVVIKHNYKNKDLKTTLHSHDFYQLIYVASGSGAIYINDELISVDANDVVFIAPMIKHRVDYSVSHMTTYEIKFGIFDSELDDIAKTIGALYYEEDNKIKNLILKIIDECKECKPYYKKSVENFISQIIIYLTRQKGLMEEDEEKSLISYERHSSIASKVKSYMDMNYAKKVSLLELADAFCVSQSHLCREFSKNFGLSPIKYLNNLRIEKAKELLAISDFSISEIGYKVGFGDIHYFSRYFNKQENVSPVKYRNSIRDAFAYEMI